MVIWAHCLATYAESTCAGIIRWGAEASSDMCAARPDTRSAVAMAHQLKSQVGVD
jgi:hypothetical protein